MPTVARTIFACLLAGTVAASEPVTEFHFVVLGDSQFHDPPGFNRLIDNATWLLPAFVIQVGDMIDGYTDDLDAIDAQWQRFADQIAPLGDIEFHPVPGNHDVYGANGTSSPAVLARYVDRWGPANRAFEYANALFVLVNTDRPNRDRSVGDRQRRWLADTLANSTATHRFVFMHRPPYALTDADAVHAILRKHRVSHVFYGHHHHYHAKETDGVRYVMTNATAESALSFDAVGAFDHLLQVSVRGDEVSVAVIKGDGMVAPDRVSPEDNYDMFALKRNLVAERVIRRSTGSGRLSATLELTNPTQRPLRAYVDCASADDRWQTHPRQIEPVSLPAQGTARVELELTQRAPPESNPRCNVRVPFQTARGEWLNFESQVELVSETPASPRR